MDTRLHEWTDRMRGDFSEAGKTSDFNNQIK